MRGVYCGPQGVHLRRDLPVPEPGPGEILLKVQLAGICETDQQLARGYMGFRGVLGHEFVARDASGRRVTAEINFACRACETCRAGRPGHCPHRSVLGILRHDGAMADYVRVPEWTVHAIPDEVDDRRAVLIEPLAAAFRIAQELPIVPGSAVAVLGDGKLGLLCAWVLRDAGTRVSLIGKHAAKLALAGPDIRTFTREEAAILGRPFDLVVDATGSCSGLPLALDLVRPCGTIVLKTTVATPYEIDLARIVIDEVRVVGSRCGPFDQAIEALRENRFDVTPILGAEYSLDDAEAAFAAAAQPGARKILLRVAP